MSIHSKHVLKDAHKHADIYRVHIQAHRYTGTCRALYTETHKHTCINSFSQMHTDTDR